MHEQIICAGFGGQGIMLMGKLLAEAGAKAGHNVTWLPSYGAEVRGGTAHSMVHISSEQIASPT
ncbi:2-oxoacid:acceptor oxidoreductase family protein, partial [Candidatus Omnitrophota bacterium]